MVNWNFEKCKQYKHINKINCGCDSCVLRDYTDILLFKEYLLAYNSDLSNWKWLNKLEDD